MNLLDDAVTREKEQILTPALLVDLDTMESNIAIMAGYFQSRPATLRPHYKSHKSPIIARLQIEAGAIGMTCAKLSEAEDLVDAGILDILIANQVVEPAKIMHLAQMARQARMIVAVDNAENAYLISSIANEIGTEVGALVEVNVGLNRCGVEPGTPAVKLAQQISQLPGIRFLGVLGYEGHAVLEPDADVRADWVKMAMAKLVRSADLIRESGIPVEIVSAGGTGTYDLTGDFYGISEVEAGSYLFMDSKYQHLALPFRQSVSLLATVISVPFPHRAVLDVGMKSISTDNGLPEVISPAGVNLVDLHEEHGFLEVNPGQSDLHIGQRVEIVPSHICTTVNLHDRYYAIRGNQIEAVWPISGRGKSQ